MRTFPQVIMLAVSATLTLSCDIVTGPGLKRYRDVSWFLVAVDEMALTHYSHTVVLGDYTGVDAGGASVACTASANLQSVLGFGWVEDAGSGKVVARSPSPSGEPYELLEVSLRSLCGAPATYSFVRGSMTVDLLANKEQSRLEVRSIVPTFGISHAGGVGDVELGKWLQPRLFSAPIAQTTRVPFEMTFSIRRDPTVDGTPVIWEVKRTFILVYERREEINTRGNP